MPSLKCQTPGIYAAVTQWHQSLPPSLQNQHSLQDLLDSKLRKWIVYEPMALLRNGVFTSPAWEALLEAAGHESQSSLFELILRDISARGPNVTHLAALEPIPSHMPDEDGHDENVLRSPSNLRMLHGDFGPSLPDGAHVGERDFEEAFWVSTRQNGILQKWAPRWTMFSRGNVMEKARILNDFPRAVAGEESSSLSGEWAVDLYAGIGYFTFSYAALGFRVLCWEINPWSVEGLRRGAHANRWSVRVARGDDLRLPSEDVLAGGEQIVVFMESNEGALERIRHLQQEAHGLVRDVRHVNCGFLPTSRPMWKPAWDMTRLSDDAWLHLHENVGFDEAVDRLASVQALAKEWAAEEAGSKTATKVEIEFVKTFAPGVRHCVFEVHAEVVK